MENFYLGVGGNIVNQGEEKAEVPNVFFAPWAGKQDGKQNEAPKIQGEMISDLLCQLDTHESMGLDRVHPRLWRKLLEGLTKPFSVVCLANQGHPRWLEVSQHDTHRQEGSEGESEVL